MLSRPIRKLYMPAATIPRCLRFLNGAALVAPDGIGIVHASRLLKTPLPERVPGIELGERLAAWMAQNGETALSFGCKARNCRTPQQKI